MTTKLFRSTISIILSALILLTPMYSIVYAEDVTEGGSPVTSEEPKQEEVKKEEPKKEEVKEVTKQEVQNTSDQENTQNKNDSQNNQQQSNSNTNSNDLQNNNSSSNDNNNLSDDKNNIDKNLEENKNVLEKEKVLGVEKVELADDSGTKAPTYTFTLTYNANGGYGGPGTVQETDTNSDSHTFTVPSTEPTRANYIFKGWADNQYSQNATYHAGSTVTVNRWGPTRSKTIYAVWERSYTITYVNANPNMGTLSRESETGGVNSGSLLGCIATPNAGYSFVNWTTGPMPVSTHAHFMPTLKQTATYTAHFAPRTDTPYNVEYYYMNEDGTYGDPTRTITRHGTTGTQTMCIPMDYVSINPSLWTYDVGNSNNNLFGQIAGDGSLTLKVYFKRFLSVTYTDGLNGAVFENDVHNHIMYGAPTPGFRGNTDRDGYIFVGWSLNGEEAGEVASNVTCTAVYTAVYEPRTDIPYTVEWYYEKNGQYPSEPDKTEARQGTTDTVVSLTEADMTAEGYMVDEALEEDELLLDGSTVLYVYFKELFTITFVDGVGGEVFNPYVCDGFTYNSETPDYEAPEREGYIFKGWLKASNLSGKPGEVDKYVTGNETYTAVWEKVVNKYTIKFDPNGGTLNGLSGIFTITCVEGSEIVMPTPTRKGYKFLYWEGSKYNAGDKYTVTEDHTFTAVWQKVMVPSQVSDDSSPLTGDVENIYFWVYGLFISMMLLAIALRRKNSIKNN